MTLRRFLDAGYALLVEEYQRLGMGLTEALEKLQDLQAQAASPDEAQLSEATIARQNEVSMKQLQALMGGVR